MFHHLLFPWIIIIESVLLLTAVGISYSSENEALESAVGPHLLHIVTISLLIITFINPSKEARQYTRVYAWTNLGMDNVALFLMLFRYSQSAELKLAGPTDTFTFTSYVMIVLLLILVDVHNVSFSYDIKTSGAPEAPEASEAWEEPEMIESEEMIRESILPTTNSFKIKFKPPVRLRTQSPVVPSAAPMQVNNLNLRFFSTADAHKRQHPKLIEIV